MTTDPSIALHSGALAMDMATTEENGKIDAEMRASVGRGLGRETEALAETDATMVVDDEEPTKDGEEEHEEEEVVLDPEEAMKQMMGFGAFGGSGSKARNGTKSKDSTTTTKVFKADVRLGTGANRMPVQTKSNQIKSKATTPPTVFTGLIPASLPPLPASVSLPAKPPPTKPISGISTAAPTTTSEQAPSNPTNLPARPEVPQVASNLDLINEDLSPRQTRINTDLPTAIPITHNPNVKSEPFHSDSPSTTQGNKQHNHPNHSTQRRGVNNDNTIGNRNGSTIIKRNAKGDMVFFKPSFIDPDPWRFAREAVALRKAKKRIRERDSTRV